MNAGEMRRKLLENGDGCGLVIDEDAALGGDFPAENEVRFIRVNSVVCQDSGNELLGVPLNLEDGGKDGPLGAEPDHVWRPFFAH